jgi:hypothetical protein
MHRGVNKFMIPVTVGNSQVSELLTHCVAVSTWHASSLCHSSQLFLMSAN